MARKRTTDLPTPYNPQNEADLRLAMEDAAAFNALQEEAFEDATGFWVTADVEFGGTLNPNPHRTLRADRINLDPVRQAMAEAREAAQKAAQAPSRARSYRAQSPAAQIRHLSRTRAGRAALADLPVSDRTRKAWTSGDRQPSAANRAAIEAAYEAVATRGGSAARADSRAADKHVADALSAALKDRYGTNVRLFNISNWQWKS